MTRQPRRVEPGERRVCQRWRCTKLADWNVWAGFYCDRDAIRAGWLPGPIQREFTQVPLVLT